MKNPYKVGDVVIRTSRKFDDEHHHYGKIFAIVGLDDDQVVEQGGVKHRITSIQLIVDLTEIEI